MNGRIKWNNTQYESERNDPSISCSGERNERKIAVTLTANWSPVVI